MARTRAEHDKVLNHARHRTPTLIGSLEVIGLSPWYALLLRSSEQTGESREDRAKLDVSTDAELDDSGKGKESLAPARACADALFYVGCLPLAALTLRRAVAVEPEPRAGESEREQEQGHWTYAWSAGCANALGAGAPPVCWNAGLDAVNVLTAASPCGLVAAAYRTRPSPRQLVCAMRWRGERLTRCR